MIKDGEPPLNTDQSSTKSNVDYFNEWTQEFERLIEQFQLDGSKKATVVGFFGLGDCIGQDVSSQINGVLGVNAFGSSSCKGMTCTCPKHHAVLLSGSDHNFPKIWAYCFVPKCQIFIYLDTSGSSNNIASKKTIYSRCDDFEWQKQFYNSLLFLFLISHVLVAFVPGTQIDANLLSLFSTLASLKRSVNRALQELIKDQLNVWAKNGLEKAARSTLGVESAFDYSDESLALGQTLPLLLFTFLEINYVSKNDGKKEISQSLLRSSQDGIYSRLRALFRACNLMPDPHSSAEGRLLFSLPPPSSQHPLCFVPKFFNASADDTISLLLRAAKLDPTDIDGLNLLQASFFKTEDIGIKFKDFIKTWLRAVWSSASGQSRRSDIIVELPFVEGWIAETVLLKSILFSKVNEYSNITEIREKLEKRLLEILKVDVAFSHSQCIQILKQAIEAYLLDSPPFYSKRHHQVKLDQAMRLYQSLARGTCATEYAHRLRNECTRIWENGRQKCEVKSLTGHECMQELNHDKSENDEEKLHRSGIQSFHACNCGRTRRAIEDPFDIEDANVHIFQVKGCCDSPGMHRFPLPSPSFLKHSQWSLILIGHASMYRPLSGLDWRDGFVSKTSYLLPWDIRLKVQSTPEVDAMVAKAESQWEWELDLIYEGGDGKLGTGKGKGSTVGVSAFRKKGMNVIQDQEAWPALGAEFKPQGKPPLASSRAFPLSQALKLASAITETKVSLSADNSMHSENKSRIGIGNHTEEILYSPRDRRGRRRRGRSRQLAKLAEDLHTPGNDMTLRTYVGVEYECPQGHRFLSCSGGTICKLGHTNHSKENVNALLDQDFPVYILCPLHNMPPEKSTTPSNIIAQLQRIHIVTPNSPLPLRLHPVIAVTTSQGETLEVGMGTGIEPIILPRSSFVVLRLPYIYYTPEGKAVPLPTEPDALIRSVWLKRNFLNFDLLHE
ncbi:uncharacterized protein VTP21DRAFT_317 [Calcarisporiella thermophila]|uniref:uncharacterized protein n=1 Tax=Calcarisporiella thermophila TaxID=911321 RepID=UPI0037423C2F